MNPEDFDDDVDQIKEDIGEMIDGRPFDAVNCALIELLFSDVSSRDEFDMLVDMINDVAQATIEDGFDQRVTLQ